MEDEKDRVSWIHYFGLCDSLALSMKEEQFTDVIAISRGGLIPAQHIAYKLNIPRIHNFGIITYGSNDKKLKEEEIVLYQNVTMGFNKEHRILIVDDIADSGHTIQECLKRHDMFSTAGCVKVATVHYKKTKSSVAPDYYACEVNEDTWVVYPYEI